MASTKHTAFRSHLAVRSNDRWILLGYVALAILAIAAIYFASTQPGFTEADPVSAIALPTNDRLRLVVWRFCMSAITVVYTWIFVGPPDVQTNSR